MEKRDLILDQIEKLGFFLQKLLGDLLNKNSLTSSIDKFENVRKELLDELNFDLEFLISQKNEDMKNYVSSFNFNEKNLESLSEIIFQLNHSKEFYEKAIALLDLADEISNTFSFERNKKKQEIEKLILKLEERH
jgi:hypothetical protein